MGLQEYQRKRDFEATPEPRGEPAASTGCSFVVQKHAARRLHYDFRLEHDGVLWSWAVPKGPSLDPGTRRLAMRTEDHPLDYASFEGVIPRDQYGGGSVLVWDRGAWLPEGDPAKALRRGKLSFALLGDKLHGSWRLVRTGDRDGARESWLLMKVEDAFARAGGDGIVDERPESVLSGRGIDEVAADPARVWHSQEAAVALPDPSALPRARRGARPALVRLPAVRVVERPPEGDAWLHELAHDGVRVVARIDGDEIRVCDATGEDLTRATPALVRTLRALPVDAAALVGVLVKLRRDGTSDRARLEAALAAGDDGDVLLYAFDLVQLGDCDLTRVPLEDRKRALAELLLATGAPPSRVRLAEHVEAGAGEIYERACELGAAGVISKCRGDRFEPARWQLSRCAAATSAQPTLSAEAAAALRDVRLTNRTRVLYPEQGITKIDLARYYAAVGDWILPHLERRPLTLVRCPQGRDEHCFYQKHAADGTPDALRRVPVEEKGKIADYLASDDLPALLSLVQIGALELHVWGARDDRLERPEQLVFDLDPDPAVSWQRVVEAARRVRERLRELGLESFVKTTGGKGLHVVAPITRRSDWDEAKAFCQAVAVDLARAEPSRYVANMAKAKRKGKVFVDYLRNARGATAVAPYSTRARPGAPVAVPLTWEELGDTLRSDQHSIRTVPQRLAALARDPWEGFFELRQSITVAAKRDVGIR